MWLMVVSDPQVLPSSGHLGVWHFIDGVGDWACALCKLQLDQYHHHDHAQPCARVGAFIFRRNAALTMS